MLLVEQLHSLTFELKHMLCMVDRIMTSMTVLTVLPRGLHKPKSGTASENGRECDMKTW